MVKSRKSIVDITSSKLLMVKRDIEIKIDSVGLRPGEKLYEEILMDEEGLTKTPNEMIFIGKPIISPYVDTSECQDYLPCMSSYMTCYQYQIADNCT